MEELQAIKVKRMLLKDNDCGVAKPNRAKRRKLLEKIAHLDPDTMETLRTLNQAIEKPEMEAFFVNQMMFTDEDYDSFKKNVRNALRLFEAKCKRGTLHLDLNLEDHFLNRPSQNICGK